MKLRLLPVRQLTRQSRQVIHYFLFNPTPPLFLFSFHSSPPKTIFHLLSSLSYCFFLYFSFSSNSMSPLPFLLVFPFFCLPSPSTPSFPALPLPRSHFPSLAVLCFPSVPLPQLHLLPPPLPRLNSIFRLPSPSTPSFLHSSPNSTFPPTPLSLTLSEHQ